ncbi:hypothetical protein C8R45DRAFT_985901 [Mycena sanguinolenta]|nr:hypothetical protein C8R45DRAFT_985901 [Mycena sanguinolenta]
MNSLPQELTEAIVKLVSAKSLRACALVSRSFVDASQRRIFHRMSLKDVPAYERLAGVLGHSPHLGQYIRYLTLEIKQVPAGWAPLESILSSTTQVEHLVIRGAFRNYTQLHCHPSLVGFLSLESLRQVYLVYLVIAPSIVSKLLETSEVVCLGPITLEEDEDKVESIAPESHHCLRHLDIIQGADSIFPFLIRPRQLRALQSITRLALLDRGVSPLRDMVLAACAPTLEILEIDFKDLVDLPALPALWHLELWIQAETAIVPEVIPRSMSCSLQNTPRLENLSVSIDESSMDLRFDWGILNFNRHVAGWDVLDKQLVAMHAQSRGGNASGHDNSKLVDVHFALRHTRKAPERYAAFVVDVKAQLPRALEAGFLTFSNRLSYLRIPPRCRFSLH